MKKERKIQIKTNIVRVWMYHFKLFIFELIFKAKLYIFQISDR